MDLSITLNALYMDPHVKHVWNVTCSFTFSQSQFLFKVVVGYSRSVLSHAKKVEHLLT